MSKIFVSTGALLEYGGDYQLLETLSKQLMYDGYEFMMDSPYYGEVDALKRYFQKVKLYIPVVHCEKSIGESISKGEKAELNDAYEKFEVNCDLARSIGAPKMVVHLWDGRTSDSNFQNNLAACYYMNDLAQKYGLDLLIENVVCSVEDPMKRLSELRENYPDIHFVFDTKMAAFHKQLDMLYEEEYEWLWREKHICHYHVNDYAGGYMDWGNLHSLTVGKGEINFTQFFKFIKKIGYDGFFTVEATACNNKGFVDIEMLNEQFRFMKAYIDDPAENVGKS